MLTRLSHVALKSPGKLEELERQVMERIRAKCPDVEWHAQTEVWAATEWERFKEVIRDLPAAA
jgi:hypothetical protein